MSEDLILHLSSNSSNQSDQSSKIAKLEARLVGKMSSTVAAQAQLNSWSGTAKFGGAEEVLPESLVDSDDSDDDDNGGAFLIQANSQKRRKVEENNHTAVFERNEVTADGGQKILEKEDSNKSRTDVNRRKQGRGRGNSTSGRGRGQRASDQMMSSSNGQVENSLQKDEAASLRAKVATLEEELKEASDYRSKCEHLEKELKELKDHEQQMKPKRVKVISDLLISVSKAERQEARMKVRQDSLRLGTVGVLRAGTVISEAWEEGQALKDINAQLKSLLELKEAVERLRKSLKKRQSDKSDVAETEGGLTEADILIQDEIYRSRLASIKREEEILVRERDRYELEKGRLIREMKRIRDEDGSRFNNFQILNHRYALLNLLGKGGFSEVYKAFDLVEHRYVACKLHGLNAQWSEEKKQSYIRHAIREYNIHKTLVHHHIVRLWDIFEIDQNTFCTVLEYCSGKDLDAVLKATPILPEREAKIIIIQIFQGLVYLNKRSQKIIHYDLKPGNVLFDEYGVAKVTDFGLSKIVEEDVGSQMELTSQGAGTYWYLPPECFELSRTPLISSKVGNVQDCLASFQHLIDIHFVLPFGLQVDVWSLGILLYQMLFGRRPFGHDQTQERILREDTIIKARKVEFPTRPSVSNEAKEFIRRCLTYNQMERPDVLTVGQDPYLNYAKK
ncbi:serine/threonine-protein kinase TOUSLED-like isoform X1 [Andrographis paniculata]|uniref:serine/threonine-protein kinase TOUSLED-like isoform X1 n=2 Tax=Andrographis paniculata TaxID=175694 RepID=UPI0021E815B0|nr:serine/threonine-protein kinase TOUSLED-like isoform X1 [Andrographis paniculata]